MRPHRSKSSKPETNPNGQNIIFDINICMYTKTLVWQRDKTPLYLLLCIQIETHPLSRSFLSLTSKISRWKLRRIPIKTWERQFICNGIVSCTRADSLELSPGAPAPQSTFKTQWSDGSLGSLTIAAEARDSISTTMDRRWGANNEPIYASI